jgi:hypothetical protein
MTVARCLVVFTFRTSSSHSPSHAQVSRVLVQNCLDVTPRLFPTASMCRKTIYICTKCPQGRGPKGHVDGELEKCKLFGTKDHQPTFPREILKNVNCCPKCHGHPESGATIRPATDGGIISSTVAHTRSSGGMNPERPRYPNRDSGDIVVDRADLLERGKSQKTKCGLERLVGGLGITKTDQTIQRSQGSSVRQVGADDIKDGGEKCDGYYFVAERLAERYRCLIGPHPDQIYESTEP